MGLMSEENGNALVDALRLCFDQVVLKAIHPKKRTFDVEVVLPGLASKRDGEVLIREMRACLDRVVAEASAPDEANVSAQPGLERLYKTPLASTRRGSIFNAHSYPTKVGTDAVLACVLAHTNPGETVLDGFAGSGTTGIAATIAGRLDDKTRSAFRQQLGEVQFGERNAVLYDISTIASFISTNLLNPPDPAEFVDAAKGVMAEARARLSWIYDANYGSAAGAIRHTVWTEHLICPSCRESFTFWDGATTLTPASIKELATCVHCGHAFPAARAERLVEDYWDDLLDRQLARRVRTPAFVYGLSSTGSWRREPNAEDLERLARIEESPIPKSAPVAAMLGDESVRWGQMHRAGYHFGITHVHHFYTRRNLIALAMLWELADRQPGHVRDALRFWISSYNASHSTLMTRIVCKEKATDFVLTGAQPGALYVSALPVEKNVFRGLDRKMSTLADAFELTHGRTNRIDVRRASSLKLDLPANSIDYVFTDPPFGDNIQYSEVNFISEAWLGSVTNQADEVIVSQHQGKNADDYSELLREAFSELYRVLKPGAQMTVAFHSTRKAIWESLRRALETSGFEYVSTSMLDKVQTSFKQTTTSGAVRRDPLIVLRKPIVTTQVELHAAADPWEITGARLTQLSASGNSSESDRHSLFSYLASYYIRRNLPMPLAADQFFQGLAQRFPERFGEAQSAVGRETLGTS